MGPLFAAVGAAIAALLEVTVGSRIDLADAQPQIVLVIAVLMTLIIGFEEGMAWAFVGGLLSICSHSIPSARPSSACSWS